MEHTAWMMVNSVKMAELKESLRREMKNAEREQSS
jgi:hypothetical protein